MRISHIIITGLINLNALLPNSEAAGAESGNKVSSPITLKEAISTACQNNKDIQIQEREIKIARSKTLGAFSNILPHLNIDGDYTYNDAVLGGVISQDTLDTKKDLGVFTGFKNDYTLSFSATDSIFNGGKDIANIKQSKVNLKVQEETLRATKLDVEFEAKRLYYGLLFAAEIKRIQQDLITQAEAHYQDVDRKFKQGTSSRFDLLQSAVHVSLQIPELVRAQRSIDLIMAELNKLMGLGNIYAPLQLKERLAYTIIPIKEDEFLKEAKLSRPEMILSSLGIDIQKWSIEMARAGRRPQVSADFNFYYRGDNPGSMFGSRNDNFFTGLQVVIPFFDGFATKAKVDEAHARYAQAELKQGNVTDQTTVDIRRACLDMKQAETIIISQRDSIVQGKEALKISIIAYDNGVGTNLDVLDAMVSLSQVEKNLASGIYDYLMAIAYLDRTRGNSVAQ